MGRNFFYLEYNFAKVHRKLVPLHLNQKLIFEDMLTDNKIKAQKNYDEAIRYFDNAHKELQLANKNGKIYQDVKHSRVACGTAYLAVLKALDGIFLLRNIQKPKRKPSIEYYIDGLAKIDSKILNSMNVVYQIIHRDGYYDGFNNVKILKIGFQEAQFIINKLKSVI